jgi:alpha-L-fucosidase
VSYKSWCYIEDDEFKTATAIVHDLVDIVSKNGNLLLNVGPKPDGTFPREVTALLEGLGDWLSVNGEAVYGTRPWTTYGQGPTEVLTARFRERDYQPFTAQDIRFTRKGNALYATCMGWPEAPVTISLDEQVTDVALLGSDETLSWDQAWSQNGGTLTIQPPTEKPCEHAYAFKVKIVDK